METRLSVTTPRGTEIYGLSTPLALSPDGRALVFAAGRGDSVRLYVRQLDSFETKELPGTEGGDSPFFSPDGRWVGFFQRKLRQLRKVALAGGSSVVVAEDLALSPNGGVWGPNDTIYLANMPDQQVSKVAANGGALRTVTRGSPPSGYFRLPSGVLPDGRHALVTVLGRDSLNVDAVSLQTGEHRRLLGNAAGARVVAGRFLVYMPGGRPEIVAVRFDPATLKVSGDPVTVVDSVSVDPLWGALGYFDISLNGTLAYVPLVRWVDPAKGVDLAIVDRNGTVERRPLPKGRGPRFSPDGKRLVYGGSGRHGRDIIVYDLDRGIERHLTGDASDELWSLFSHDGRSVVFNSDLARPGGYLLLFSTPADGSGHPARLPTDTTMHQQPFAWAANDSELLYTQLLPTGRGDMDIWAVAMNGSARPRPLMQTAANESQPALSPDGRWLAWMTDASGRREVMVRRYPDGPSVPVSREGGVEPVWGPGGRELYFRDLGGTKVMVAGFQPGEPPVVQAPRALFIGGYVLCAIWCRSFDVSPDGRRFVMGKKPEGLTETGYWSSGSEIRIVPHWDRELRKKFEAAGGRR
jgi:serine/threonine-protein kinase